MIMQNYVGCDISKQWLDFFDEASSRYQRIDNQADAITTYVAGLCPGRDFVVMEATGVHDRLLRHALAKAGVAFSRHNPAHTHHYAKSTARRAKTDRLDARMLSGYGRRYHPEAEPAPREEGERLQSLARHRDHLVEIRARLKKHLGEAFDEIVIAELEELIANFNTRIKVLEGADRRSHSPSRGYCPRQRADGLRARRLQDHRVLSAGAPARARPAFTQVDRSTRRPCPFRQQERQAQSQEPDPGGPIARAPCPLHGSAGRHPSL
nr:transposase [Mesorhizobium sp. AR07]